MSTAKTWVVRAGLLGAGTLMAAGCTIHVGSSDNKSTAPAPAGSKPAASAAAQAQPLTYDLVRPLAEQKMGHDPNCGYGEWGANSTGIDTPYRSQASTIQQFDRYQKKGTPVPQRGPAGDLRRLRDTAAG